MEKFVKIVGENVDGDVKKSRTACRAIVIEDGKILMSYEVKKNQWNIPGGGLEPGETMEECCIRELGEETGYLVTPLERKVHIKELIAGWELDNYYFTAKIVGETERHLTDEELDCGLSPRWIDVNEILEILGNYAAHTDNKLTCGLYRREYTALTAALKV